MALVFMAAAVIFVPLSSKLGLGSVVGYLIAGLVLGPSGIAFISEPNDIMHFAELGVVLLLFLIGLELNPKKLWDLRKSIFGTGLAQVGSALLVFAGLAWLAGFSLTVGLVAAMGFALSSTAVALQIVKERSWLGTSFGQSSFAVLLFQDLAVIPMLLVLPLLVATSGQTAEAGSPFLSFAKSVFAILLIIFLGRYVLRHVFRLVAESGMKEVFTALILLLVLGISFLMSAVGLSMAFGAFLAGVLLADSEYRHEIEIDIEPFKGLLLGLFFISVGMSTDLYVVLRSPLLVLAVLIILVGAKYGLNLLIARFAGIRGGDALLFAALLAQGGEFAFVLFATSSQLGILNSDQQALLSLSVALSMMATPLLLKLTEKSIARSLIAKSGDKQFDHVQNENARVLIAGYGRFGQMVGRLLHSLDIPITVLDSDPNQIEIVRSFGWKAFYGDATRMDLLHAAGLMEAKVLVIAIDDMDAAERIILEVKELKLNVHIITRARNRAWAFRMMNHGVEVVREVASASVEMAERTLVGLGYSQYDAFRMSRRFYRYDKKMLADSAPHANDQKFLVSTAAKSRDDLIQIMKQDQQIEESTEPQWS